MTLLSFHDKPVQRQPVPKLPVLLAAGLAFTMACNQQPQEQTISRQERDSLYNQLSDEQKRLPENALAGLEVADGLDITLFASEPMLTNPTNMDIDARGRVWITEAYNYRMSLNPHNPQRDEGDRIIILEDTDGDGKADNTKVFYQGTDINSALGIAVLGNKVIVSCSPNVFVFTDENGDDKPDKIEKFFTGISGEQHDHAMHAFVFGPDGKLYFNYGNAGGQLMDKDGNPIRDKAGNLVNDKGEPYREGMVFRCNPDGSELEVLGHNFRNNYEVAVDSYGTMWQSDNDDDGNRGVRINYVMEFGNYGYKDEMTGAGWQARRTNMEEEIPLRHWHLNDPGVVPNLLQTGAGSPTGILVYEGNLLPKAFHNQIIHSDAGPNVVRAYPVQEDGAGYKAEIKNIVEGVRDQWFRPSDVTVAPDGSLFISDWYDPGVGGHQMGDMNRGRVYRVAPPKTPYKVTAPDLTSAEKAVEALQSPNMAVRYLAWNKLNEMGKQAEPALQNVWKSDNPRFRARAFWLLANIDGQAKTYIDAALNDSDPNIRITGLRAARQLETDIIPRAKQLVSDKSPQVRREVAIALRHNKSPEAAGLWAELAAQHDGKDRWYLEALGIGADRQWDAFFAAYQQKVGDKINSAAGQDIVWRARTSRTLPMLADQILSTTASEKERLRYFRAFDFHTDAAKDEVLLKLLAAKHPRQEQITMLTLSHLSPDAVKKSPQARSALQQVLASVNGTQQFVDLVSRYELKDQNPELLKIVLAKPDSSIGVESARLLMKQGGAPLLANALNSPDESRVMAALSALSRIQNKESMGMIEKVLADNKRSLAVRQQAVRSLGRGWSGEERLMTLVRENKISEELKPVAAGVMASVYRKGLRDEAAKYLQVSANEGKPLASIDELITRKGNPEAGKQVFQQQCQTCHQINGEGANFGPGLSEIGDKLPKQALYVSIIHPDAGISFGYEGYMLKLKDGSTAVGIISSETADGVELRMPGGVSSRYEKSNIVSKTQLDNSMMPALHQTMSEQQLVDLVEYLSTLKKDSDKKVASR
jgi:putative membrane-bound dehydrogenase-like protein